MATEQSLASLIVTATKEAILQKLLDAGTAFGLDTESWQVGDPTRSLWDACASRFADYENETTGHSVMIKGVLLGLSAGAWLKELAKRRYNVTKREATFATCTIRLTNTTAQDFGTLDPDDVTVRNGATEKDYRNTTAFALGPTGGGSAIVDVEVQAVEAGTGSNSEVGTILQVVSGLTGVTVTNLTAAVAQDDESDDELTERCEAKLESLSPNGPRGAYEYVLKTPEFQSDGKTNVTRVRVIEDSDFGYCVIFIAGASGALVSADRTKAEATVENWANPFVVDANVILATNQTVAVTYQLWVYDSINKTAAQIQTDVANQLLNGFKSRPIGGDDAVLPTTDGKIYLEWIRAQILEAVSPHGYRCVISAPSADVSVDLNVVVTNPSTSTAQVPVVGTITPTVTLIPKVSG